MLRPVDVQRAFGTAALAQFDALRRKVDPQRLLTTALAQRVFGG